MLLLHYLFLQLDTVWRPFKIYPYFLFYRFTLVFVLYQLPSTSSDRMDHLMKDKLLLGSIKKVEHTIEDILNFIGIFKTEHVLSELIGYVLIICIITFCENLNQIEHTYSFFSKVTYFDLDDTIASSLKYLVNYGFYRFSLEVSNFQTQELICIRLKKVPLLIRYSTAKWLLIEGRFTYCQLY